MAIALTESGNGVYSSPGFHLDNTHKYRLNIKTANGKQYLSDYVPVLDSPPIDSISYDKKGMPSGRVLISMQTPTIKAIRFVITVGPTRKHGSFMQTTIPFTNPTETLFYKGI